MSHVQSALEKSFQLYILNIHTIQSFSHLSATALSDTKGYKK